MFSHVFISSCVSTFLCVPQSYDSLRTRLKPSQSLSSTETVKAGSFLHKRPFPAKSGPHTFFGPPPHPTYSSSYFVKFTNFKLPHSLYIDISLACRSFNLSLAHSVYVLFRSHCMLIIDVLLYNPPALSFVSHQFECFTFMY